MSELDALLQAVLAGEDVTHIGQEYRSRTRMIQVDFGYAGQDGNWTGWELSKKQEVMMALRPHKPDPDKSARVRAALDKAVDKLCERPFPNWPTLPRGY